MANKVYYGEYSLRHWIELLLSKNLVLPEYQRYFVWDESKISELIETFKEKRFIPPVTIGFFQDETGSANIVIDGQQRLTSILLSYLKKYPDKEGFKKKQEEIRMYNESSDTEDFNDDVVEHDNILEWNFSTLQEKGHTKDDILKKMDVHYKDLEYNLDDTFWDENYLGFSYLVPKGQDINYQQKYYSSVFRAINIQGQTLLPQESRASLYYLNKDLEPLFDPDFMKEYKIKTNNGFSRVDFIRYLALITQYLHTEDISMVGRGQKSRMEKFYEEYIYSVVSEKNQDKFGDFSETFNYNYTPRLKNFKKNILNLPIKKVFKTIIDLDMFLFGLVFHTLFNNKTIKMDSSNELIKEIEEKSQEMKNEESHSRSPNNLKYLRLRLETSINIYSGYVNE